MLDFFVSFLFEYVACRIGAAVVVVVTLGRVRPKEGSNPFYFGLIGMSFVVAVDTLLSLY